MKSFQLIAIVSLIIAGLCVLLILPWLFGIPGKVQTEQEIQFVEGWTSVLVTISLYPISVFLLYGFNLIVWILSLYDKISQLGLMRCQQVSTFIAIAIFAVASIQIVRAIRLMSGT